jgi:D-alanyl-D-alanine carboxypeptidase
MHGMLLPSGNDAAVAMATHLGSKLLIKKEEYDKVTGTTSNHSSVLD